MHDLVIRNARVIDASGGPARLADNVADEEDAHGFGAGLGPHAGRRVGSRLARHHDVAPAALVDQRLGLIDNWLRHVQDVAGKHRGQLDAIPSDEQRFDRLCELNVVEQVTNVCQTTVVREAWNRGQELVVHGWIYRLSDGLIRDLEVSFNSEAELAQHALPFASPSSRSV